MTGRLGLDWCSDLRELEVRAFSWFLPILATIMGCCLAIGCDSSGEPAAINYSRFQRYDEALTPEQAEVFAGQCRFQEDRFQSPEDVQRLVESPKFLECWVKFREQLDSSGLRYESPLYFHSFQGSLPGSMPIQYRSGDVVYQGSITGTGANQLRYQVSSGGARPPGGPPFRKTR